MPSSLCGLCAILAQFPETSALPLTPTPAGTSQSSVLARPDFENRIARIPLNGSKFNLVSFFFFQTQMVARPVGHTFTLLLAVTRDSLLPPEWTQDRRYAGCWASRVSPGPFWCTRGDVES